MQMIVFGQLQVRFPGGPNKDAPCIWCRGAPTRHEQSPCSHCVATNSHSPYVGSTLHKRTQRENRTSPYGILCPFPCLGVLPTLHSGFRTSPMFEWTPVVKGPGCARKKKHTSSEEESGGGAPISPRGKARDGRTYTL